ncbi:glycoside hydrolase family 36 protein [Cohnella sp. GCM10020058]|uniref:glycoside hydrolase family 36 protein n=1 Tax=Cohnella sp. GCM10020058 TaxID=3317330 RepID=UPI0036301BF6
MRIEHQQIKLQYGDRNGDLWPIAYYAEDRNSDAPPRHPGFQLAVAGIPYGFMEGVLSGSSELPAQMKLVRHEATERLITFEYFHEALRLTATVEMERIPRASVLRVITTVRNNGEEAVVLTHLSSACLPGIGGGGIRPWFDRKKLKVHYALQTWNGEGQWRSGTLEELGLYPTSTHPTGSSIHFGSTGSWSTSRHLPMTLVEDMETRECWYAQIETSSIWHLEIGHHGTTEAGGVYIQADGASERFGGAWTHRLRPGESFSSVPAAIGCCKGDFQDAIRELTAYRRSSLKPSDAWDGERPVVYNDYMNTLWGDPTIEKELPLIDAAAESGADVFCIDAGWFGKRGASWGFGLGDWQPSDDRFNELGLQGLASHIRSKGLIPGIWLEMEVCGEGAALSKNPDAWFLCRNGARVGGGARYFLDFRHPEVAAYMFEVIERLHGMGFGYIKNDYNADLGNGADTAEGSAAHGLLEHTRAFYGFIDEVRARYPKLILENCGSGAMRQDYGALARFHVQSTSDQEDYRKYPSIAVGSLASILPEQAGIWAYPYPLAFPHIGREPSMLSDEAYLQSMADGEQTIFNMVNGMSGNLYLSGHLDRADARNRALIQEAVALYKQERSFTRTAHPYWPIGMNTYGDEGRWTSVGLVSPDGSRMLLSVWRLDSPEAYQELPLGRYFAGKQAEVRQLYPSDDADARTYYDASSGALTVHLPNRYQARYFEVKHTRE